MGGFVDPLHGFPRLVFGIYKWQSRLSKQLTIKLCQQTVAKRFRGDSGLTIAPTRLRQIRKERRPLGKYSSTQQVRYELREAEKLFKKYNIPFVDTTEFSIEEISSRILDSKGVERRVRP